jgi:ABC-type multidrug transport system permease subunit
MGNRKYWPIGQLVLSRMRLFLREPAAIFWVYGFPIVMLLALGIAFRENPEEQIKVDLVAAGVQSRGTREAGRSDVQGPMVDSSESPAIQAFRRRLASNPRIITLVDAAEDWRKRLQAGKTDLVIEVATDGNESYQLWDEPHRVESRVARYAVEAALHRGEQVGTDSSAHSLPEVKHLEKVGSRYIDFLLPGMIGMGLMGGGLWGVGFVVVDMRVRKLLKRFLATPMRRSDFLVAVMCSRLVFTLADIVVMLIFGYVVFQIRCQGSYVDLTAAVLLGGTAFAGIGLLVSSRAQTLETVSGLMNLIMLPMWILSGVFFSSERFPEVAQPFINLLPLTALNQLLRGIILEGKAIASLWPQVVIMAGYAVTTFAVALRIFRWR